MGSRAVLSELSIVIIFVECSFLTKINLLFLRYCTVSMQDDQVILGAGRSRRGKVRGPPGKSKIQAITCNKFNKVAYLLTLKVDTI